MPWSSVDGKRCSSLGSIIVQRGEGEQSAVPEVLDDIQHFGDRYRHLRLVGVDIPGLADGRRR